MGSERSTNTIQELIDDGIITAHKDGNYGSMYPRQSEFGDTGVLFLTAKLVSDQGFIDFENAPRLNNEKAEKLTFGYIESKDVLLSHNATVGRVALTPDLTEPVLVGTSLTYFRTDRERLLPEYFAAYLSGVDFQNELKAVMGLSTRNQVPITTQRKLEVVIPPLPEQKAIAHILGTLDDKIELNRRMNATLEGMAQALFKSWFVDFDPVIDNALAAGNPIPDELAPRAEVRKKVYQAEGMALANGTTQQGSVDHPTLSDPKSVFPAAFQFTDELGWIPEGWEVGSLSDLAALNPESWTAKKHPDSVNYVDLANTKDGRINETTAYEFREAPSRARRVLKQHDTIIGTVRPGNRSFAYIHDDGLTGSTGFAVLRANEVASRSFIYLGLTRDEVIEVFAHLADGAAYPAIRPEVVGNTQIIVPSSEVLQLFDDLAAPLIAKVGEHQREAETLSRLRDTLLPRLISGQLTTNN